MSAARSADGGELVDTGGYRTNCQVGGRAAGEGDAVLLLHGSGPGVTAQANWQGIMPLLAKERRVVAPDLVGFGHTERPRDLPLEFMRTWTDQKLAVLDHYGIETADVVGNSFGGVVALATAVRAPRRVRRLVLMGSAGVPLRLTPELDFAWGYTPSKANMRRVLESMADDPALVTDELVELRYEASLAPGLQENYAALFPAPRQRWLDALVIPDGELRSVSQPALLIHGRNDRVVPVESSVLLAEKLPAARLEILEDCGHWVMIERKARFLELVRGMLGVGVRDA